MTKKSTNPLPPGPRHTKAWIDPMTPTERLAERKRVISAVDEAMAHGRPVMVHIDGELGLTVKIGNTVLIRFADAYMGIACLLPELWDAIRHSEAA